MNAKRMLSSLTIPIPLIVSEPCASSHSGAGHVYFTANLRQLIRVKNGIATTHPLQGDEMRALRALKRESSFVFVSERGAPFTKAGFAKMVARTGLMAKFKFGVHPHMLRHACGYALANRGHDTRALQAYLGHKKYSSYGAIYGTVAHAFQRLLERLARREG